MDDPAGVSIRLLLVSDEDAKETEANESEEAGVLGVGRLFVEDATSFPPLLLLLLLLLLPLLLVVVWWVASTLYLANCFVLYHSWVPSLYVTW